MRGDAEAPCMPFMFPAFGPLALGVPMFAARIEGFCMLLLPLPLLPLLVLVMCPPDMLLARFIC